MSDVGFSIRVKPEVIQKYNNEKVEKLVNKHGLSKAELENDGIDLKEADGMQLKTFQQLSANTGKITKATLVKFDDGTLNPTEKLASDLKKTLPITMGVSGPYTKDPSDVINVEAKNGLTQTETFTMVGGKDKNFDGKLDVGSEILENDVVKTTNDAVELGGADLQATPGEAMKFFLKKKGIDTNQIIVGEYKTIN